MISRRTGMRTVALGATAMFLVSACAGGPTYSRTRGERGAGETVTLKVNFWGDFGLTDLIQDYETLHPNVSVQLNGGDFNQQHETLQKALTAGKGAPDLAAIDEGFIVQFRSQADKFVNLLD